MPELTPVDAGFVTTAPLGVSTEVDIGAGRDEVWEVLADNRTWPEWFVDCRRCTGTPPVWSESGHTRRIEVGLLKVDERAVELVPEQRWVMTVLRTNLVVAKRWLEMIELRDTSRDGEVRTEIRFTAALEPASVMRPFGRILTRRLVNAWGPSLENLHGFIGSRR